MDTEVAVLIIMETTMRIGGQMNKKTGVDEVVIVVVVQIVQMLNVTAAENMDIM